MRSLVQARDARVTRSESYRPYLRTAVRSSVASSHFSNTDFNMTSTKAAPAHPRLTLKKTPDIDLIQAFIAKNGVTKPTTAQEQRYARKTVPHWTR